MVYSLQFTVYSLWFTVYSLRFTDDYIGGDVFGLQFTVYGLQMITLEEEVFIV